MIEQLWKNCSLCEGLPLDRLVEDCILCIGPHAGAEEECEEECEEEGVTERTHNELTAASTPHHSELHRGSIGVRNEIELGNGGGWGEIILYFFLIIHYATLI